MSYFRDLFKSPAKGYTAWLLHVLPHGQVVIYRLDSEGKPMEAAAGTVGEVLGVPLKEVHPIHDLDVVEFPQFPWTWGFRGVSCWRDVVEVLNGPANQRRGQCLAAWYRWDDDMLRPYLRGHPSSRNISLGPKAVESDRKRDEAEAMQTFEAAIREGESDA